MKFFALFALIAVKAQDEEAEAAEPLEAGADCSAEGATCAEGLCCGTATPEEGDALTVCSEDAETATIEDTEYKFACNAAGDAEEAKAAGLALSVTALATLAYTLA